MIRPYRGSEPFPVAYSQLCLIQYAVCCKITLLSFTRVIRWTLNEIWSFLKGGVYKQVGSLSRGLKIAHLYKRIVSGRVTLLPGTELRPVSFNKRQQNEEAFSQKHSWRTHVSHTGNIVSRVSFCMGMLKERVYNAIGVIRIQAKPKGHHGFYKPCKPAYITMGDWQRIFTKL